jgi:hypothetical protein
VGLLEHDSFRRLLSARGIKPRAFERSLEALEAADIMATVVEMGDRVLADARAGHITAERAEALLLELTDCYTDPLARAKRLFEIRRELKGREG